jgi:hypothetical protein
MTEQKAPAIVSVMYIVVFWIAIGSAVIVLWLVAMQLEAVGYVGYIQQAIDKQCPELTIVVDASGYSGDPSPNWSSLQASCYLMDNGEWDCGCEGVP